MNACSLTTSSGMASTGSSGAAAQLETSKTGIPKAPFVHDVEAHLGGVDEDAEPHLRAFQETMSRYKMMEVDRQQRRRALEEKIPEMRKTLSMVQHLKEKRVSGTEAKTRRLSLTSYQDAAETLETHFELNDTLYAKATIKPVDTVNLWLGVSAVGTIGKGGNVLIPPQRRHRPMSCFPTPSRRPFPSCNRG